MNSDSTFTEPRLIEISTDKVWEVWQNNEGYIYKWIGPNSVAIKEIYTIERNCATLHRLDGPAIVGIKPSADQYYIDGKRLTKEEFETLTKKFKDPKDFSTSINLNRI